MKKNTKGVGKVKAYDSYIFSAPYPKEGMVLWVAAKIQYKMPVQASEELVREWIAKRPKDKQRLYIPIPIILSMKVAPKKTKKKH